MATNTETNTTAPPPQKKSKVRHTRAIQRDRSKRLMSTPPDEVMVERKTELVHPATLAQVQTFHQMGLRERTLTLPVMMALVLLLDLCSHLPRRIWYEPDAEAHDQRFWPQILPSLKAGSLLIFDLGFTNFQVFAELTKAQVTFMTRAKSNLAYQVERTLLRTTAVHDELVWIGSGEQRQLVRFVQVLYRGKWYRYLSNKLDDKKLPVHYLFALYWQRGRIEDAYNTVKSLLGLAYFWGGAQNAVEMQVAATCILFAVLVDLTDAVAEALKKRFSALSLEMVYRNLPYFTQAYHQGRATDIVAFLAANAERYGILQRRRNRDKPSVLGSLMDLTNAASP